jgi:hypothetical protein
MATKYQFASPVIKPCEARRQKAKQSKGGRFRRERKKGGRPHKVEKPTESRAGRLARSTA